MLNINLSSKSSAVAIGLLIFFVPFFTYLSPENLKQLSGANVLEIFLSLIAILIIILISSFSVDMLLKRFFNKNIFLFPLLCFAFYLNFLYTPFLEPLQELLYPKFGFISTEVFIFLELFCIAIIVFGAKFNVFALRMILIFAIFMLGNSFIPLFGYLYENIGKNPTSSYEIKSKTLVQDDVLKKRNVYYIILDEMIDIETAEQFNVATREEVDNVLSNAGLKYIDKSLASYSGTDYTLSSLMLVDYHQKPSSPKSYDSSNFYPRIMYNMENKIPLLSYLNKANSAFFWTNNNFGTCIPSRKWTCINLSNSLMSNNLFNFSYTTPIPKFIKRIFKKIPRQDSISPFLEYIDKNGLPKTPFFAFIHHDSPHAPFLLSSECEPTYYSNEDLEGYKASFHCTLKMIQIFMEKINNIDPEAVVIFQGDHGLGGDLTSDLPKNEQNQLRGRILNAIKAPEICFDKYGLPKTNVNTIRFSLNCAYGFKLPYRKNTHYENQGRGVVVERKVYD